MKLVTELMGHPVYLTHDATIIKNDDSSLCYDVIITHQKF